jgi:hypothetical protein
MMDSDAEIRAIKKPSDRFKAIKEKWKIIGNEELKGYQQRAEEEKLRVTMLMQK